MALRAPRTAKASSSEGSVPACWWLGCHACSCTELRRGSAGSSSISRDVFFAGWEEAACIYVTCSLTAKFFSPYLKRSSKMSCSPTWLFCYCTSFSKQGRRGSPHVSITRSLLWSLSRQSQKFRRSPHHMRRSLPQSRLRIKGGPRLCN